MPYPNKSGDVIRTYLSLERDFKDQAAKLTEQRNGVRKGRLGMDWGGGGGVGSVPCATSDELPVSCPLHAF